MGVSSPSSPASGGRRFHLVPRSIFGQLLLIFSVGFLAFLVLGAVYVSESKSYYILRGLMGDRAKRIADIVLLLDSADAEGRARLIERMDGRPYFSLDIVPDKPELHGGEGEEARAAGMFEHMLNFSLFRVFSPHGERPAEEPDIASVSVRDINIPGTLDEMYATPSRYAGRRPGHGEKPSIYQATAAVPLSDGNWAVFHDQPPVYPGMRDFPFGGIVVVELFFVLISLVAFYLIVRPLRRLAQAADNFGRDLPGTPPLPETGPREVREAAQAFNRMQRRIREFVDERARTLAAVSHDLRTPLTRMRLRVEQLDDAQRLPLQNDMDELQQLMDTTIDLARNSSGEDFAPVDVAALLESLVEDRQDMGLNVILGNAESLNGVVPLRARPLSLKRCLGNLLDNAVRYGGSAEVSVEDGRDALTVTICDHGPGIPEEDLQRVFEPFYRLEPSRSRSTGGSGLGLAIARSMARQHGGDIELSNRAEGGLCARVTFPRHTRRPQP